MKGARPLIDPSAWMGRRTPFILHPSAFSLSRTPFPNSFPLCFPIHCANFLKTSRLANCRLPRRFLGCAICRLKTWILPRSITIALCARAFPEVVFGAGKTPDQIAAIARRLSERGDIVLITRASREAFDAVAEVVLPDARYEALARLIVVDGTKPKFARARGRDLRGHQRFAGRPGKPRFACKRWAPRSSQSTTSASRDCTGFWRTWKLCGPATR